jgi:hypothetical protein
MFPTQKIRGFLPGVYGRLRFLIDAIVPISNGNQYIRGFFVDAEYNRVPLDLIVLNGATLRDCQLTVWRCATHTPFAWLASSEPSM